MTYGLIPVVIHYESEESPEPQRYAKGGLVVKAKEVRGAGRYGDTELIHVNKDELDELRLRWGEPTINPETGMPEFFLGKFGKILGKVAKIAAPIAVSFIPGIGPIASAALGAAVGGGLGALGGGGLKGALTGAVTGGLGAFGGNAAGFGKVLAGSPIKVGAAAGIRQLAPGAASKVISPLASAATSAASTAPSIGIDAAKQLASEAFTKNVSGLGAQATTAAAPAATTAADTVAAAAKPNFWNQQFLGLPIKNKIAIPLGVGALALSGAFKGPKEDPMQTPENFFQPQLGGKGFGQTPGGSNITGLGSARAENQRPMEDYARAGYMPEYKYFSAEGGEVDRRNDNWRPTGRVNASTRGGSDYGVDIPIGHGALSLDARGHAMSPERLGMALSQPIGRGRLDLGAEADRGVKPKHFSAKLTVPFEGGGGVGGEGSGRDDKIEARLSDGEYVMDAETVAMLGDGSTKAGAKALDDFRVKVRQHKGSKLAKGKISPKAKAPHAYMRKAG